MSTIKINGIVIAENNLKDFDKMITLLTPNGQIGCSARGARRSKSQLMAGTQFLSYGNFLLFKTPSSHIINSCETLEVFYNIRTDLDKLQMATNLTKLVRDTTYENQDSGDILQLFLNSLYLISNSDMDLEFIETVFKLRLIHLLGFTPMITSCCDCGKEEELNYFSFKDNGFKCKDCGRVDSGAVEITDNVRIAIIYIIVAKPKKVFSFKIPDEEFKTLKMIVRNYTNNVLEKEYK